MCVYVCGLFMQVNCGKKKLKQKKNSMRKGI